MFRNQQALRSAALVGAAAGLMLSGSAAFAAPTGGYAPVGGPGVVNVPGGFSSVVSAMSITPHALVTTTLTVTHSTVGITIAPGAFSQPTIMVVTAPSLPNVAPGGRPAGLSNFYPVAGLGLGFQINATHISTPHSSVTVTIKNPAIRPGDQVIMFTAAHRWVVIHHILRIQNGLVTFFFSGDPDVAIAAPVTQYGYHVYGVHANVQTNGSVRWTTPKPVGPVTYRTIGTDPNNTKDWLVAEMTRSVFGQHQSTPVPWVIYPQPKARGKVGPVRPLPASAKA